MNQTFLLALTVLFSTFAYSQTIGNKPIREINVDYLEIVEIQRMLSTKISIIVDYGQPTKLMSIRAETLLDENGREKEFNSLIDALNFMSIYGYEFLSIVQNADPAMIAKAYLLKKKVKP